MEGKRFRHTLRPSYSIGGIIQFVNGYWPSLDDPPCTDNGLCAFVERDELFGRYLFECSNGTTPTQHEATERNADLLARAEAAVRRLGLVDTAPSETPAQTQQEPDGLPTPTEIKLMNKRQLIRLGEQFGIADGDFMVATKADQIRALLTQLPE